jgi:hypothetical protein
VEAHTAALVAELRAGKPSEDHRMAAAAIQGASDILNSNALIAALLLTFELTLLTGADNSLDEPYQQPPATSRRFLLYAMLCSVLSHLVCVYIAAEAAFVLSKIKLLPPDGQLEEVRRLYETRLGASLEFWSGVTLLGGLVFCMVGLSIATARKHRENAIDTAIIYVTFLGAAVGLYLYAWLGIGGYAAGIVGRHKTAQGMTWGAAGWRGYAQLMADRPMA